MYIYIHIHKYICLNRMPISVSCYRYSKTCARSAAAPRSVMHKYIHVYIYIYISNTHIHICMYIYTYICLLFSLCIGTRRSAQGARPLRGA